VRDKEPAASQTALLEGSQLVRKGRADVVHLRERARMKKLVRAIVIVGLIDFLLYRLWASGFALSLPHFGPEAIFFIPPLVMLIAIIGMPLVMLLNGKSPHITVYPEQVETALTEIKGLDNQVDEVIRSIDAFLGYATFKEELGGTPRRGILFEGPPGTGKTFLAKAMAKQAGVPFLFIPAPAFQSMWQGMSAFRIRSFFRKLRKAARKEGGAIGFIEEIDAVATARGGGAAMAEAPTDLARTRSLFMGGGDSGNMVNELLIQMQSFDQPPLGRRIKAKIISWMNGYMPETWQMTPMRPEYSNILLIAATNRGDSLDPALLRPGRFDRRLYFDVPTRQERRDLIDFFMGRKAHDDVLDEDQARDRIAAETFAYTPVMIEHLFDEALLLALRDGRRAMSLHDIMEAKFNDEVGLKQTTSYTDFDREAVATHEAGHATVAYIAGTGRRLEILSIIKRRGSLGMLAHSDEEERLTRTKSELENGIAIALGGLAAEELCLGESGTGPGADLAHATQLAAQMVGSFGMAGSLISYEAVADGPLSRSNLVGKILANTETKQKVEDILEAQRVRVAAILDENRDIHAALVAALLDRDELVREDILEVIEKAIANRP
jgi:cell division protease FtsH